MNKRHQSFTYYLKATILKASWSTKKEVILIIFLYFKVSCLVRMVPMRFYYKKFFVTNESHRFDMQIHLKKINFIQKIISVLPGEHTCLKECIIVHLYFRRQNIFVPISLGVNNTNGLQAHAWFDSKRSVGFHQIEKGRCQK